MKWNCATVPPGADKPGAKGGDKKPSEKPLSGPR